MSDQEPWDGEDRRKMPRRQDAFYKLVQGLNIFAWVVFVAALIVFHYARPELISGLQQFWGVEGRSEWSESLSIYLFVLLGICLSLAGAVIILKRQRNRRKEDFLGINAFLLLFITGAISFWIISQII